MYVVVSGPRNRVTDHGALADDFTEEETEADFGGDTRVDERFLKKGTTSFSVSSEHIQ